MQPVTTSTRTLEFAPPCKQLSLILVVIYTLSFSLTWYRVWWDSIIGLLVASFGYYTLRDANAQQLNVAHIGYYYKATIVSMVSHVIAVAVVLYYLLQGHLLNDILDIDEVKVDTPGHIVLGFLLALLAIEITLTAFLIWRCMSLQAEIARNSVIADLSRGHARA